LSVNQVYGDNKPPEVSQTGDPDGSDTSTTQFDNNGLEIVLHGNGDIEVAVSDASGTVLQQVRLKPSQIADAPIGQVWRFDVGTSGNYLVITKTAAGTLLIQTFDATGTLIVGSTISV